MIVDHFHKDEATCPACGRVFGDSFEYADSDKQKCDRCGVLFWIERNVEVTYTTGLLESEPSQSTGKHSTEANSAK